MAKIILIGSNGGLYLLVGVIVMILLEVSVKKKANSGNMFKSFTEFKDEYGEGHEVNYYLDKRTGKYKKIDRFGNNIGEEKLEKKEEYYYDESSGCYRSKTETIKL